MKSLKAILICIFCLIILIPDSGSQEKVYVDSVKLKRRLEWFQNQKFGLLIEFGIWAPWGITESWPLNQENYSFHNHPNTWEFDFDVYREAYWNLSKVFYPHHFDENQWADIAKEAGMKYIIFYAKHHDGFCMYDTKLTDYKVTSPECPYSDHPNPDITERLSTAFRNKDLGVGIAFSYADWHSPYFWKPDIPAPDKYMNYDIEKEPQRWQNFIDFYISQVKELMTGYGKIDILWFDSGWLAGSYYVNKWCRWKISDKGYMKIDSMARMVRRYQPEILIVNRYGDIHEDYETPERTIPEEPLGVPWETCESIADFWSFVPYDNYRSSQELIYMLVDIISKGGNFLLSVPPMPNGRLTPPAVERLKEMGEWLEVNGDAIYGTRLYSMTNYKANVSADNILGHFGNIYFTKKKNHVYAIVLDDKQTEQNPGALTHYIRLKNVLEENGKKNEENRVKVKHYMNIPDVKPVNGSKIYMLGVDEPLEWEVAENGVNIYVPYQVIVSPPCKYAYSFQIQVDE
ncbi:alpha-L-fucosidase [Bacteroidota bacterium]